MRSSGSHDFLFLASNDFFSVFEEIEFLISLIADLTEALITPEKPLEKDRESVTWSEEKLGITTVPDSFPTDMDNLTTMIASKRNIPEFQTSPEVDSSEVNEYRGERNKLESSIVVENEYEISSVITPSNVRHRSTEVSAIPALYLVYNMDAKIPKSIDYGNDIERLRSACSGDTESLNDCIVEILTFLSIAIGICGVVFIVYLCTCKRSQIEHQHLHNGIEKGSSIDVSHLQVDRLKSETSDAHIPDDLW